MRQLYKRWSAVLLVCAAMLSTSVPASAEGSGETGRKMLVPMGNAVGIDLDLQGVVVADVVDFHMAGQTVSPAKDAGIEPGDVIKSINGQEIRKGDDVKNAVQNLDGSAVPVRIERRGQMLQFSVTPFCNEQGGYELGVWVRDGILGIGTLTFFDPENGTFGALGHPVSDMETGRMVPVRCGTLHSASITGVVQGKPGKPGQLDGRFSQKTLGSVLKNTEGGIFGQLDGGLTAGGSRALPVAKKSEVQLGKASIFSNISGEEVQEFSIEITRIYYGTEKDMRTFMIRVTDDSLLAQTGGVVQGMSGSPIIQNGRLIGAVTHVLVNDPTRGYGIFIENMLEAAQSTGQQPLPEAS